METACQKFRVFHRVFFFIGVWTPRKNHFFINISVYYTHRNTTRMIYSTTTLDLVVFPNAAEKLAKFMNVKVILKHKFPKDWHLCAQETNSEKFMRATRAGGTFFVSKYIQRKIFRMKTIPFRKRYSYHYFSYLFVILRSFEYFSVKWTE